MVIYHMNIHFLLGRLQFRIIGTMYHVLTWCWVSKKIRLSLINIFLALLFWGFFTVIVAFSLSGLYFDDENILAYLIANLFML